MASDIYNTGSGNVGNAANAGNSAIGSFDPNAWASNTQGGLKDLWNQQGSTQNQYMSAYKNAISSNPTAQDYYNQGMDKFNVQPLQNTANSLNNAMLQAPNSNLQAARGFNVDQNQIDQKTSQDLQRLGPAAQAAQNNATTAQGNALAYQNAGLQQNATNLLPIQQQGQYLMDSYARQQSGFTTVAQQQLQSLQDKMNQGVALSSAEMQAYTSLASSEQSYQASLASSAASVKSAQINNNFKTLNPSQGLYAANTGQITPYNG